MRPIFNRSINQTPRQEATQPNPTQPSLTKTGTMDEENLFEESEVEELMTPQEDSDFNWKHTLQFQIPMPMPQWRCSFIYCCLYI